MGNEATPLDPDSTIADIGAYYFKDDILLYMEDFFDFTFLKINI